jgi:hypothetical protein
MVIFLEKNCYGERVDDFGGAAVNPRVRGLNGLSFFNDMIPKLNQRCVASAPDPK